jgi:hypothetical protein
LLVALFIVSWAFVSNVLYDAGSIGVQIVHLLPGLTGGEDDDVLLEKLRCWVCANCADWIC